MSTQNWMREVPPPRVGTLLFGIVELDGSVTWSEPIKYCWDNTLGFAEWPDGFYDSGDERQDPDSWDVWRYATRRDLKGQRTAHDQRQEYLERNFRKRVYVRKSLDGRDMGEGRTIGKAWWITLPNN